VSGFLCRYGALGWFGVLMGVRIEKEGVREWIPVRLRCCLLVRCIDGFTNRGTGEVRSWSDMWVSSHRPSAEKKAPGWTGACSLWRFRRFCSWLFRSFSGLVGCPVVLVSSY